MEITNRPHRLEMDSVSHSGRKDKSSASMFSPLLEDTDDFALHIMSPNIFKTGVEGQDSASKESKIVPVTGRYSDIFNESLLNSPNPNVQYELLYEEEVTPIKRDLFGSPVHVEAEFGPIISPRFNASSDDSSDSESGRESPLQLPIQQSPHLYNLRQHQIDPQLIKCPSCHQVMQTVCDTNTQSFHSNNTVINIREVHAHVNECITRKNATSKAKQNEKQIESDITRNIARVRKAMGKFELQDRIKLMESLYRLGKSATTKGHMSPRRSSLSSLYDVRAASSPVNENMEMADQQALALLYTGSEKPKATRKRKNSKAAVQVKQPTQQPTSVYMCEDKVMGGNSGVLSSWGTDVHDHDDFSMTSKRRRVFKKM